MQKLVSSQLQMIGSKKTGEAGRLVTNPLVLVEENLHFSISEQCTWYEVSRNSYYYAPKPKKESHLTLRQQIKDKYTKDPSSGSRRITAALNREGIPVKRAIVRRPMQKMKIKGIIPKRNLSIQKPGAQKFPYLLKNLKAVRPNQVWSTDITYLKTPSGFMYLNAIINVYSRKMISWELSNSMSKDFCINCYKKAGKAFGASEILNSDQGSQYTSAEFS